MEFNYLLKNLLSDPEVAEGFLEAEKENPVSNRLKESGENFYEPWDHDDDDNETVYLYSQDYDGTPESLEAIRKDLMDHYVYDDEDVAWVDSIIKRIAAGENGKNESLDSGLAIDMLVESDTEDTNEKLQFGESLIEDSLNEEVLTEVANWDSDVYALVEELIAVVDKNNFWAEVADYDDGPMGSAIISFDVKGDWKHDHIRFNRTIEDFFANHPTWALFKMDEKPFDDEDGDDSYESLHTIYACPKKDLEKLNSFRRAWNGEESLDEAKLTEWEDNGYRQHVWAIIDEVDRDKVVDLLGEPEGEGDYDDGKYVLDYYFNNLDAARDFANKIPSDIEWDKEELDEAYVIAITDYDPDRITYVGGDDAEHSANGEVNIKDALKFASKEKAQAWVDSMNKAYDANPELTRLNYEVKKLDEAANKEDTYKVAYFTWDNGWVEGEYESLEDAIKKADELEDRIMDPAEDDVVIYCPDGRTLNYNGDEINWSNPLPVDEAVLGSLDTPEEKDAAKRAFARQARKEADAKNHAEYKKHPSRFDIKADEKLNEDSFDDYQATLEGRKTEEQKNKLEEIKNKFKEEFPSIRVSADFIISSNEVNFSVCLFGEGAEELEDKAMAVAESVGSKNIRFFGKAPNQLCMFMWIDGMKIDKPVNEDLEIEPIDMNARGKHYCYKISEPDGTNNYYEDRESAERDLKLLNNYYNKLNEDINVDKQHALAKYLGYEKDSMVDTDDGQTFTTYDDSDFLVLTEEEAQEWIDSMYRAYEANPDLTSFNYEIKKLDEKLVYGIYTQDGDGRREVDRVDSQKRAEARVAELGDDYWWDELDEDYDLEFQDAYNSYLSGEPEDGNIYKAIAVYDNIGSSADITGGSFKTFEEAKAYASKKEHASVYKWNGSTWTEVYIKHGSYESDLDEELRSNIVDDLAKKASELEDKLDNAASDVEAAHITGQLDAIEDIAHLVNQKAEDGLLTESDDDFDDDIDLNANDYKEKLKIGYFIIGEDEQGDEVCVTPWEYFPRYGVNGQRVYNTAREAIEVAKTIPEATKVVRSEYEGDIPVNVTIFSEPEDEVVVWTKEAGLTEAAEEDDDFSDFDLQKESVPKAKVKKLIRDFLRKQELISVQEDPDGFRVDYTPEAFSLLDKAPRELLDDIYISVEHEHDDADDDLVEVHIRVTYDSQDYYIYTEDDLKELATDLEAMLSDDATRRLISSLNDEYADVDEAAKKRKRDYTLTEEE